MAMTIRFAVLLVTAVLFGLAGSALAQDDADPKYIFGTRYVLISPSNMSGPNYAWWGDKLPMEYTHAVGTIVKTVNEARKARGNNEVIDYKTYPVNVGGEMQKGENWEYYIDFQKMSPQDVAVVLAAFPMEGALADLKTEMRPVGTGYFYQSSQEGGPVTVSLPGGDMTFESSTDFEAAWDAVDAQLTEYFGSSVKFDMGLNRYKGAAGYNSFDVNITIYMDDSWQNGGMAEPYYD